MRLITIFLISLLALIQHPLWVGKGGWMRVWELELQLRDSAERNAELQKRNDNLASEIQDLKQGQEAIEERARLNLGMIKNGEYFVQTIQSNPVKDLQ